MLKRRTRNIQVATADIVHSFVVHEESTVAVLDCRVGGENGVVRLDDCCGDTWGWVDGEFELGFLAVICGETLEEKRAKT